MKKVRIYKQQPCMECGGSIHRMQEGGSFVPHIMVNPQTGQEVEVTSYNDHLAYKDQGFISEDDLNSMAEGGDWIQGAIKNPGRCTPGSPNYDCPKGSPQYNLAKTLRHIAESRKKKYGGDIALQNESTDSFITNKNNKFKDHLAANATTVYTQEEMLNFANNAQPTMNKNIMNVGGDPTSHPGYVGNPNLDMYLNAQKQLADSQQQVFDTFGQAMANTNFNKQLVAKTKFLKNDLGRQAKKEYKALNKEYRKMERNPLLAYQKMQEEAALAAAAQQANAPQAAYGGTYPMYVMGGIYPPMPGYEHGGPHYDISQLPPLEFGINPAVVDETGGIGASMRASGLIPKTYTPQGGVGSWTRPGFWSDQIQVPYVNPKTENQVPAAEEKKEEKKVVVKKKATDAATTVQNQDQLSEIEKLKKEIEELKKGKTSTEATTSEKGNVDPNASSNTTGTSTTPATTQNQPQGGYMTPLGVVYPNVGWGRRGNLPFMYNPGDITRTEIETRRALLKGNRPKKITFYHGMPQGVSPYNNPTTDPSAMQDVSKMNPEQLKNYLNTFEQFKGLFGKSDVVGDPNTQIAENQKNKEEVSQILEQGMKPSPDAVEVQGLDPNQSAFGPNGAFSPWANNTPAVPMEPGSDWSTGTPAATPTEDYNQEDIYDYEGGDGTAEMGDKARYGGTPHYNFGGGLGQAIGIGLLGAGAGALTAGLIARHRNKQRAFGGDTEDMPEYGSGGGWGKALGYGLLGAAGLGVLGAGTAAIAGRRAMKRSMDQGIQAFNLAGNAAGQMSKNMPSMNPMGMMNPMSMMQQQPQPGASAAYGMEVPQYFFGGGLGKEGRREQREFNRALRRGQLGSYYMNQIDPNALAGAGTAAIKVAPMAMGMPPMAQGGQNQMVQGWDQVREGVAGVGGPWVQGFHNIGKGLERMGVPRQFTDPVGGMMQNMNMPKGRYGMEYKVGGQYELTDAQIRQIIANGGEIEYI